MSTLIRRTALVLAASALAGGGLACSSSSSSSGTTTTTAAASGTTGDANAITVHMKEWTVEPDSTSAAPGKVTFDAHNLGTKTHELVLFKTDLAPDKLPLDEDGAVDEKGAGVELVAEVENVAPGTTKPFTAEVTAGNYYLVCNVVDADTGEKHFSHQMYAAFKVA